MCIRDRSEGDEKKTQVNFKGKLSIGIDELSNTLVVSTEGQNLMDNVSRMIKALDDAARPVQATVKVLKVGGNLDSAEVRKAVARALGDQAQQGQQSQRDDGMEEMNQGQPNRGQGRGRGPQRGWRDGGGNNNGSNRGGNRNANGDNGGQNGQ